MPKFLTLSPTHIPGKKAESWKRFLKGGYIALGWDHTDYTGWSIEEIIDDIKQQGFQNEGEAIDAYSKLLSLNVGDVVAINNVNHGLFGIGVVDLGYKFQKHKHDTGSPNIDEFYSHYRKVKWIIKDYVAVSQILQQGEKSWKARGTVGGLHETVPDYIRRLIAKKVYLTDEEFLKASRISKLIQNYFNITKKVTAVIREIIPLLIKHNLFKDKNGKEFRDFLRKLHLLERLDLIPQVKFNLKNSYREWYLIPVTIVENHINWSGDSELIGYEGKQRELLKVHKWIERDPMFASNYKSKYKNIECCMSCNFNPSTYYGIKAIDFLQLHHITPLKIRKNISNTISKEKDMALLCPNCHAAIHKLMSRNNQEIITLEKFKKFLVENV